MTEHPNAAILRSAYEAMERGDVAAFAGALDGEIVWHESMPGFAGDYHGRDGVLAFLGRMFAETGIEVTDLTVHHVLADDSHATVLLAATMTLGDRSRTGQYVDVYRLRDGKATEHWHLPLDPKAEEKFFAG
jgi:predicted SnoaL-like aldol condensation-catalyzing enzyme